MNECPTHFYRYRSLADDNAVYAERTVCHSELYFPRPSSFNDPFDCRPCFSFEASKKERDSYYRRLIEKYYPGFNREQRRQEMKAVFGDRERNPNNPEILRRVQNQHTKKITEQIGVLCLSEVKDDILMWSHYADSHRGICLEFDGYFEFFARAQKVKYPSARPIINPFCQSYEEMLEAALLTKASHWDYECEWRIVHYEKGPGTYSFPTEALTGIILGAQISDKNAAKVIEWVQSREHPVKLYRASASETTFSLNIKGN